MLSTFDYVVVVFYLLFLSSIGWFFRHSGKDSSEYFRGGAKMSWWMVGASGFMGAFSAWTFTGAAGLAYDYGFVVIILYWANSLGFFLNWSYFARMSRNTRAITALEAVRARLGPINEQVFTWLQVPFQVLQAGIWLYGLAIFCTPVFGLDLHVTIIVCGVVVVFVAAAGGSWAVVAGDFIQALVLVPITFVAAVTAIQYIGGPSAFLDNLPAAHWDLMASAADFGPWWIIAVVLEKVFNINGLNYASRYLCVSDARTARKAALFTSLLFLFGSVLWFIPPLAARAGGIEIDNQSGIANPAEMSFIIIAAKCLPMGLLGLLVTGIISSTLSSMDSGLNRNAGIFVRSFYLPILRPLASEKELVLAGRLTTLSFGAMAILMALFYSSWRDLGVFQLMMNFSALVATPYAVPLFWCLLIRRSPDWGAWSTIAVCCAVGGIVSLLPGSDWALAQVPGFLATTLTWAREHSYVAITLANVGIGSLWFLTTAAVAGRHSLTPARAAQVASFFQHVDTDLTDDEVEAPDNTRHLGIAKMCIVYGAFITVLAVISPTWSGRLWLLFCAVFMLGVGLAIRRASQPTTHKNTPIP